MDFYLFLCNKDSVRYFPTNRPSNFTINLENSNLCIDGQWEVAITDISVFLEFRKEKPRWLIITSDISEASYCGGRHIQILRRIPVPARAERYSETFSTRYYFKVTAFAFKSVNIRILNEDLDAAELGGDIAVTLHLKKV